jgi:hypothetical protein
MKKRKSAQAKQSEDNVLVEQLTEKAARAMKEWLKAGVDTTRPIDSLNKVQMMALATIARDVFTTEASYVREQLAEEVGQAQLDLWLG